MMRYIYNAIFIILYHKKILCNTISFLIWYSPLHRHRFRGNSVVVEGQCLSKETGLVANNDRRSAQSQQTTHLHGTNHHIVGHPALTEAHHSINMTGHGIGVEKCFSVFLQFFYSPIQMVNIESLGDWYLSFALSIA